LLAEVKPDEFIVSGMVESGAQLEGKVRIGAGTTVNAGTKIYGPVLIGENCTLADCIILPNTTIGAGSTVKKAQIQDSIILNKCRIDSPVRLKESIIGAGVTITEAVAGEQKMLLGENTSIEL
jgi:NDP-sugar pyrophosphorylase family protein